MLENIKRFDLVEETHGYDVYRSMEENNDGEFVYYEHVELLVQENARLKEALRKALEDNPDKGMRE